jgi:hypothetical protein
MAPLGEKSPNLVALIGEENKGKRWTVILATFVTSVCGYDAQGSIP